MSRRTQLLLFLASMTTGLVVNLGISWTAIITNEVFSPGSMITGFDNTGDYGWIVRRADGPTVTWASSWRHDMIDEIARGSSGGSPRSQVLPAWTGFADDLDEEYVDVERLAVGSGWPARSMWYEARWHADPESPSVLGGRLIGDWQLDGYAARYYDAPVPRAIPLRPAWRGTVINTIVFGIIVWSVLLAVARVARRARGATGESASESTRADAR